MTETRYEHCQIHRDWSYKGPGCLMQIPPLMFFAGATYTFWFYADAISPIKGKYTSAESQSVVVKAYDDGPKNWPSAIFDDNKQIRDTFNSFVSHLVREGWEPVSERGKEWWHLRFKRSIR